MFDLQKQTARAGRLDVFVNNAGYVLAGAIEEVTWLFSYAFSSLGEVP